MTQLEQPTGTRERLEATVRKAQASDHAALVSALARAFDDDPFVNWMAAQDKRRARRVYDAIALSLRITAPHGEVYTTDGVQGGALWEPPGKWKLGLLQQALLAPQMARVATWRRMARVLAGINAVDSKHPKVPHYYLFVLGVDTEFQGRGLGSQLMRPVLEKCDRERVPAYLESSKEKNVPLYERNGFKVTEVFTVPNGGPPLWLMWREPA